MVPMACTDPKDRRDLADSLDPRACPDPLERRAPQDPSDREEREA